MAEEEGGGGRQLQPGISRKNRVGQSRVNGVRWEPVPVLRVLGSGGAARTIVVAFTHSSLGRWGESEISFANARSRDPAGLYGEETARGDSTLHDSRIRPRTSNRARRCSRRGRRSSCCSSVAIFSGEYRLEFFCALVAQIEEKKKT